jgi:hypothetical protein
VGADGGGTIWTGASRDPAVADDELTPATTSTSRHGGGDVGDVERGGERPQDGYLVGERGWARRSGRGAARL